MSQSADYDEVDLARPVSVSVSECQVSQTEKIIISELQPGAALVMGWFEFPHLILRDRLHQGYT